MKKRFCPITEMMFRKIGNQPGYVFHRLKDAELIITSKPYKLIDEDGSFLCIEIEWYEKSRPFYSNIMEIKKFMDSHELVGDY